MLPQVMMMMTRPDSDDDKTTKKKAVASIAIQEKPSLFDTPSCFMAKATKVQTCDDGCD
jgi:hypothetical protein